MAEQGLLCWSCGRPTGITGSVMRSDSCDKCMADLRCCRGCRHFDPTRRFQCKESIDHQVVNKEKANFCDFYQHRTVMKVSGGMTTQMSDKDIMKKKFDDLFDN